MSLIYMGYWLVALLVVAVLLAYLMVRLKNNRITNRELRSQNENLERRLQEAELNLSILTGWYSTRNGNKSAQSEKDEIKEETGADSDGRYAAAKRKVRITKILGKGTKVKLDASFEGLEEQPPQKARPYRVFTGNKKALVTSLVVQVAPGYIQTLNSWYKIEVLEEDLNRVDFGTIWERIRNYEGNVFETKTGIKFTYHVEKNTLRTDRTDQKLSKSNFAKAYEFFPISNPAQIKEKVRGPAYVWAILHDPRISARLTKAIDRGRLSPV